MNSSNNLSGKKIAILVADGFEQEELTSPRDALLQAGADVHIVSPEKQQVRGWKHTDWGDTFDTDVLLENASPGDYDALVLPGGLMNPDTLRTNNQALDFVRAFFRDGKTVAAICHGPWILINAGMALGRRMTSYKSIQADLENAGAAWADAEVIVDNGLITSRKPDDLPAFNRRLVEEIAGAPRKMDRTAPAIIR